MKPQTTPEQIAEVEQMRDRLADRFRVVENDGERTEALTAVLTELTTLRALVAAAGWCSLEEWPLTENEFSGAYWSGIALLEPTKDSMVLDATVDFVHFDAGVCMWWGTVPDSNGDSDIDPARIIALYHYPEHPERFNARIEEAKERLRKEFPKRWYGKGNPYSPQH